MRAVSFDAEAARLMGINVDRTISATFAIGSALAGAAGVVFGVYYIKIEPLMGVIPGLKAFVAAVLGGIGIIPGAMVGGLLLGVIESLVSAFGYSLWRDGAAFIVLILILIFLPQDCLESTKEKRYRREQEWRFLNRRNSFGHRLLSPSYSLRLYSF
jgi:branched-chain amino acid transport system permease protein